MAPAAATDARHPLSSILALLAWLDSGFFHIFSYIQGVQGTQPQRGHVLITGASTGIGRACALHLAELGFSVIAGVRDEHAACELRGAADSIHPLVLNITDSDSIARAVDEMAALVGSGGLRGLVNNAGICVAGPIEVLPLDRWRQQFEVNLFGHIAMTQAMLPLLRLYLQQHGRRSARIVMMSSIAGRASQPLVGAYCASKYALEAVSDALRNELKPEGISLSIVEPGAFRTEIWRKAIEQMSDLCDSCGAGAPQRYARQIAAVLELTRQIAADARGAGRVARVVADCLIRPKPPIRTLVGTDARLVALMKAWLPDRWFDSLLRWAMDRAVRELPLKQGAASSIPNLNEVGSSRGVHEHQFK